MIRIFNHYISITYVFLLLIECIIFFNAMYWGNKIRFLASETWYTKYDILQASGIFALALTFSCFLVGLYRRTLTWDDYNLIKRMLSGFILAFLVITQIYYFLPETLIARSVLVYAFSIAFLAMVGSRFLFYKFVNLDNLKRRVLVVGTGNKAQAITTINDSFIHKDFKIIGCLELAGQQILVDKGSVIQSTKKLPEICEELKIDEIVIALDDKRQNMPVDELLDCKMSGIKILDTIAFYEREKGIIALNELYPSWLVYSSGFEQSNFKSIGKRAFDVLASLVLLAVAWPFMLITAIAIFVESGLKGPVIYRQKRVGENDKTFEVLKFRSMRLNAEKGAPQWAAQNDRRVTRVGGVIRKYRIDELPQIFNVLKGEMSFVGPRPERPEFVQGFEKTIPYYSERHRVRPGITGWAQLCYPYGANEHDALQKLQYDLYYVKNYSLFLDLFIMFHTVEVILWGKGAR
ncbi:TIGR03013 family XrtA/PEP-CTERM system glycosyltransferase [Candidatus Methylomicrobium oryzae]|uniref:TIGR03013 family XrtA/PEP-CTERM system glycosyltransferase n=1 Tax=Candidatus Methylomicrobium oryzae TaxID=2802053 RepID=UPI00192265E7|nr:TIGR03013 family XrtA/PEP-CTERM system glycosyltransferase [Methylomicrobium sp. RS1]MBL1265008.1 TIGR03013 family PEP-CTERM/XrtA system glycosyltransferase [Methylomicrobium sp. RS1]